MAFISRACSLRKGLISLFEWKDLNCNIYSISRKSYNVEKKKTEFTPDDVYVPDITGMFTTCLINKKPFFFDMRFFSDMGHYKKIMGYDKPIDFKLGTLESDKSPESIKK
ncbi:transmembrane protein 70 homolog, mitochondrial isoform X2 [Cephus cinctus]|uniref:Transmembrane protein 70 homolog, mitochondrial isoform X2 n=1 Tax=Cephus cinctus TaxID=211228 RepID=A0AAJ7RGZ0_CEPCN|nr:transmembrane protein 70 homolog, mitochondrial isoform X2 [Cephus cinctus]